LSTLFAKEDLSPIIYLDKRGNQCYNVIMKNKNKADNYLLKNATIYLDRKHGQLIGDN